MKNRKMISGLAVLTVSAFLFAGCGGSKSVSSSAAAPAAETETETQIVTEAPVESAAAETAAETETETAVETVTETEAPSETETVEETEAPADIKLGQITVEDAKTIAFSDIGLTEADVTLKKAGLETEDGITKYEIEFFYNDTEYEYDIDPATGEIMKLDHDAMDNEDYQIMDYLQEESAQKSSGGDSVISEDRAFGIALNHAGVSSADAASPEVKLDYDDDYGRTIYEVEFKIGSEKYSYDIDPATGDILDCESEIDD